MSRKNRPVTKDMYWFAHGGVESPTDICSVPKGDEENELNGFDGKGNSDRRTIYEEHRSHSKDVYLTDGSNSSGPPSIERDDRLHAVDKRIAVEERKKLLWEAEQERNDAVMKKHMEREAALEARRNAQRSTISFAFGSSVPRNVDALQIQHNNEIDSMSRSFTAGGSSHRGEDVMTRSMIASTSAPRGRRKNDLMPTVPYDRTAAPRVATSSSSRRRSVSMTRLDQLAQPRKHYVEATKALSTASSGTSSMLKDGCSPNRPLSSASEHSGGKVSVTRRVRSSPRKPRPVSIAGTIPDQKYITNGKSEIKATPMRRTNASLKKSADSSDVRKTENVRAKSSTPKSTEKLKATPRPSTAPTKSTTPKLATPKATPTAKITPKTKKPDLKTTNTKAPSSHTNSTPKVPYNKSSLTNKKKSELQVSTPAPKDTTDKSDRESCSPPPDSDSVENDKSGKRIISAEEARAALAEKRRLAREQAEREAELERQRQEELKRLEEERILQEEEEQRKMEEEHLHLIEEHRRQEEEKLRKAIEDQKQKEEDERMKRDEEAQLKAEQERKAKEEAEKLRLELEERLRKEEEERAERKKRLEKIMSRTRGKSSGTSPSGSISESDQIDSAENQQEGFSSGANSLESNDEREHPCESVSSDDAMAKMEVSSAGNSLEANLTYEFGSNDVSLNSNDLMLPNSETSSQDNSIIIQSGNVAPYHTHTESSEPITPVNLDCNTGSERNADNNIGSIPVLHEKENLYLNEKVSEVQSENVETTSEGMEYESLHLGADCHEPSEVDDKEKVSTPEVDYHHEELASVLDKMDDIQSAGGKQSEFQSSEEITELDSKANSGEVIEIIDNTNYPGSCHSDASVEKLTEFKDFQQNLISNESTDGKLNLYEQNLMSGEVLNQESIMTMSMNGDLNAFEEKQNPFFQEDSTSNIVSESENQESLVASNQNPFFDSEPSSVIDAEPANESLASPKQVDVDAISNAFGNEASLPQELTEQPMTENLSTEAQVSSEELLQDIQQIEENSNLCSSTVFNQSSKDDLSGGDNAARSSDDHSSFLADSKNVNVSEELNLEIAAGDNSFVGKVVPNMDEYSNVLQSEIAYKQELNFLESEQISTENHNVDLSEKESLSNVTLIKDESSENYIGIISSIDNDHLSNNFPKLHDQLTRNNFECASITDTEDSSLDSNLSQVAATESSDKNINISNGGDSMFIKDSVHLNSSNNIGQSDNPFISDSISNQSSIPQLNNFTSELYSNGHGVESSELDGFDGRDILDVDHSKNNIFENVDTMDFGKVSPDPFLVKGSSRQIPGNPFLVQDDQNEVLMSSDFLK